jgi:hypothetical protein
MDEKEMYLQTREREFQTTLKVLHAYPGNGDIRPAEKSKTARELAWIFVGEETVLELLLDGKPLLMEEGPAPPATMKEVVAQYEQTHKRITKKITGMALADLNRMTKFPVAPKKMGDLRMLEILWMFQMDQIHHRGQFSVYLRIAGGKVPSIYGPSADEPWM